MVVAHAAPVGVERQPANARDEVPVHDELAALPLLAEAEVLERHEDGNRKAVVDRRVLDIRGVDAGFGEGNRTGPDRPGIGEVHLPAHLVLGRFTGADELHRRALKALRELRSHHDDRPTAIGHHAAVHAMQGTRDDRRIDNIFDGEDVPQQGIRIVLGVMRSADFDPGELFAGRAVLVHMSHRRHGIQVQRHRRVGRLERRLWNVAASIADRRATTPEARASDQRNVALAGGDRFGCMRNVVEVGRPAGVRRVGMLHGEAHVVDHAETAEPRGIAGTIISVHVFRGQPSIFESALGDFRVELGNRFVLDLARGMLIDARNIGFAFDAHVMPSSGGRIVVIRA
jgi:hypothetical protein